MEKLSNNQIAWRAAQDIADGAWVNLGIGLPEKVAQFHPLGREAIFHTENGILNFGEAPAKGSEDWDVINAGKKAVTIRPDAAFFHHADSFAMMCGGHLDGPFWAPMRWPRPAIWRTARPVRRACPPWAARWTLSMVQSAWRSSPTM